MSRRHKHKQQETLFCKISRGAQIEAILISGEEEGGILIGHVEGKFQFEQLCENVTVDDKEILFKDDGVIYSITASDIIGESDALTLDGWEDFAREMDEAKARYVFHPGGIPIFIVEVVGEADKDEAAEDTPGTREAWNKEAAVRRLAVEAQMTAMRNAGAQEGEGG